MKKFLEKLDDMISLHLGPYPGHGIQYSGWDGKRDMYASTPHTRMGE